MPAPGPRRPGLSPKAQCSPGQSKGYLLDVTGVASRVGRRVAHPGKREQPPWRAKAGAREWAKPFARAGLAARAAVYAVVAVLAALIAANGSAPSSTSGPGALAELARQPYGLLLVALLAAGLAAYAVWRLLQAVMGIEPATSDRPSGWKRFGWLVIAAVYASLLAQAVSILVSARSTGNGSGQSGSGGGPSSRPTPYAARILRWPGGPELLGLLAVVLLVVGIALAIWALTRDYGRILNERRMPPWSRVVARATGILGNLTRAVLLALVALYLLLGAVQGAPSKVKALDQLLQTTVRQPLGPLWVALIAAGLATYALYSVFETLYRRV